MSGQKKACPWPKPAPTYTQWQEIPVEGTRFGPDDVFEVKLKDGGGITLYQSDVEMMSFTPKEGEESSFSFFLEADDHSPVGVTVTVKQEVGKYFYTTLRSNSCITIGN